jgi:hypothetical protein
MSHNLHTTSLSVDNTFCSLVIFFRCFCINKINTQRLFFNASSCYFHDC